MAQHRRGSSSRARNGAPGGSLNQDHAARFLEDIDLKGFVIRYSVGTGNRIKFPRQFTDRWGQLIDQEVILTTKDRHRHLIRVERRNGNIWLARGWVGFAEEYNIQILDTIYFRHNFNDHFIVVMFDAAGLEYRRNRESPTVLPVSFFKQIVTRDYATRIVVPDKFTMAYGMQLQNPITLIGPDEVQWTVGTTTVDDSLWFTEGWTEFAMTYNIKKRDFVYVKVRDTGAMRIRLVRSDTGMIGEAECIGPQDVLDPDFRVRELWTTELSEAAVRRRLPLYIPSRIVSLCLEHRPGYVTIVLPSGDVAEWKLNWTEGWKDTCNIGYGWYEFKEEHNLQPGQHVRFSRRGNEDRFIVEIA